MREYMIRCAYKSDVPEIARIFINSWRNSYRGILPDDFLNFMTLEGSTSKWQDYIGFKQHRIFLPVRDGEILGFCAVKKDESVENCMYIDSLHIRKEEQNKGIGTALILHSLEYARNNGYSQASITALCGNDGAKSLYERLGAVFYKHFIEPVGNVSAESDMLVFKL